LTVSKPFPDLSLYTIAIDGTWDEPLWDDQAKPRYTQCIAANLYRNTVPFETTAGSEYRGNFLAAKSLFATIRTALSIRGFRPPNEHALSHGEPE
jgi:hypothetical protein